MYFPDRETAPSFARLAGLMCTRAAARDRTARDNGPNEGGCLSSAVSCCGSWVFDARDFDRDTGLYYYRARDYDPVKGRCL